MLEKKIEAGKKVAKELFPAEQAIDAAILGTARTIIATVEGRKVARLSQTDILSTLVAASEGMTNLVQSMSCIASAHDEIVELRDELGLPTTGYGCEYSCSPRAMERHLKVVSDGAA